MTPSNRIAALSPEIAAWRRDIHAHPEIRYEEHRTAALVAAKLKEFGVDEVVTGIGKTGVVGVIHGRDGGKGKAIGLRADMDALPMTEMAERPHKSTIPGKMHACGHDGHTAMLLGAAKVLAETRNFAGRVVLVFQPAEEGGAGAKAMMEDGLIPRFGLSEIYGMHNRPGVPVGQFEIAPGPQMACSDRVAIHVTGKGAHGARPHQGIDPVLVGAHIVTGLQSIVARAVDPLKSAVVSITMFHAGETDNVIPQTARLAGTVRTFDPEVQRTVEARIRSIAKGVAEGQGAEAEVIYTPGYPVLVNHAEPAAFCADVAEAVTPGVNARATPVMGGEDFAFFLQEIPGAFIFVGNGASAALHHPAYDFDDAVIPAGVGYWTKLVERRLAG
jgi:hippurate hydrolase